MGQNIYRSDGNVLPMNFYDIDWADSDLENICIEYDRATLVIWNDALQKRMLINCSGLAGLTNLCIWDDTIIMNAQVLPVANSNNDFIRSLYAAYDKNNDFGGRSLSSGLLELKIELSNYISFSVYCLKIEVESKTD